MGERNDRLNFVMEVLRAEECSRSLLEFTREFWDVIEPSLEFDENWHHVVICAHLEAVSNGEIRNLLINVPPGTSKSTLVSVMWPAWEWTRHPELRFFGASYSEPLAIRDAELCKRIVTSDKYQRWYATTGAQIKQGNNQKTKYATTKGGWRMATTVKGQGTGEHPHRKIVDDPHNVKQSESDVERQQALDWFDGTLSSRGLMHKAATVVIMQRLHQVDLTGHIVRSPGYIAGEWVHLVIPMEYEATREYPPFGLGLKDPRKKAGALLWPSKFPAHAVASLAASLGEYRAAGQLQQRPAPAGGGVLKVEHIQLWPWNKPLPLIEYVVQSYDTAFTEQTTNDPSAGTVWGIFTKTLKAKDGRVLGTKACALLLDSWQEHLSYTPLKLKLIDDWKAEYGGDEGDIQNQPRRPDSIIIEEKGSGISLIQDLRVANLPVMNYNPGKASKITRGHMAAPYLEADCIYVLESRKEPGKPRKMDRWFVSQCELFPNDEHDDGVDTFTQFVLYAARTGLLQVEAAKPDPIKDIDYNAENKRKINPYG